MSSIENIRVEYSSIIFQSTATNSFFLSHLCCNLFFRLVSFKPTTNLNQHLFPARFFLVATAGEGVTAIALTACSQESSAMCSTLRFLTLSAFSLAASSPLTKGGGSKWDVAGFQLFCLTLPESKLLSALTLTDFFVLFGDRVISVINFLNNISLV
jgi:hypothetical protein